MLSFVLSFTEMNKSWNWFSLSMDIVLFDLHTNDDGCYWLKFRIEWWCRKYCKAIETLFTAGKLENCVTEWEKIFKLDKTYYIFICRAFAMRNYKNFFVSPLIVKWLVFTLTSGSLKNNKQFKRNLSLAASYRSRNQAH